MFIVDRPRVVLVVDALNSSGEDCRFAGGGFKTDSMGKLERVGSKSMPSPSRTLGEICLCHVRTYSYREKGGRGVGRAPFRTGNVVVQPGFGQCTAHC